LSRATVARRVEILVATYLIESETKRKILKAFV